MVSYHLKTLAQVIWKNQIKDLIRILIIPNNLDQNNSIQIQILRTP